MIEPGEFDLVGFAVGVVDRATCCRSACSPAIASSGSRARGCVATATRSPAAALLDRAGRSLDGAGVGGRRTTPSPRSCSRPSVIYAPALLRLARPRSRCTRSRTSPAAASRATSPACSPTRATRSSGAERWEEPRIFAEIRGRGRVSPEEMEHVFNLGLGMLAVVPAGADAVDAVVLGSRSVGGWGGRTGPRKGHAGPLTTGLARGRTLCE